MKNHMYKLGRVGVRLLAGLALVASMSACKDEFTLDDEKPAWLGESVYVRLQNDGNFTNYLRLMDDLGMKEVLSRTGSRTVFAANDDAFNKFYQSNATLPVLNAWHNATSYDNLSTSQKALLAKSTMLNNAITVESLSTQEGTELERGMYLRRPTLVSVVDSVTYTPADSLPVLFNDDKDLWAPLRGKKGVYLTDGDGTNNMLLCFTVEQMSKQNITDDDFELFMGRKRNPTDVFIYDAKVLTPDITCQNGYINMVEKVIRPLPNMAEVIRTNGMTNIFSHILDRFSVPVYVDDYNTYYRQSHPEFKDSIHTKWYISGTGGSSLLEKYVTVATVSGKKVYRIPYGQLDNYQEVEATFELKFDPAWNTIATGTGTRAENDMAAIFVPEDGTLLNSFQQGALKALLVEYGGEYKDGALAATVDNLEPLYRAIDRIPIDKIATFVNNLMRKSFNGSVKSKFASLKNDAQEALFGDGVCNVDHVELACNGAIYITKSVYAPADYVSVASPAFINDDKRVMYFAIYDGSLSNKTSYMNGLNYYAYLKAMTSRFTFFMPNDVALQHIYNPLSFKAQYPRMLAIYETDYYKKNIQTKDPSYPQNPATPLAPLGYTYDVANARRKNYMSSQLTKVSMDDMAGVLTDILQTHTLVHQNEAELISQQKTLAVEDRDQYYVTKNNDALKLTFSPDGTLNYIQGGFQIENEQAGIGQTSPDDTTEETLGTAYCKVLKDQTQEFTPGGNGDTYIINAPAIGAIKSVNDVLKEHDAFKRFLDLCECVDAEEETPEGELLFTLTDIIAAAGMYDNLKDSEIDRLNKYSYSVFRSAPKNCSLGQITSFFSQYNYSVFVPTAEAIDRALAEGNIIDWNNVVEDFKTCAKDNPDYSPSGTSPENKYKYIIENQVDKDRIKAKIIYMFNWMRLHFMDTSVFADNSKWDEPKEYATSCFYQDNNGGGNFVKLRVKRGGRGQMTVQGLDVDAHMAVTTGTEANVLRDVDGQVPLRNIMAREILVVNASGNETSIIGATPTDLNHTRIGSSSGAVVHLIDNVLLFKNAMPDFNNPAAVRAYIKYNKVMNKDSHDY